MTTKSPLENESGWRDAKNKFVYVLIPNRGRGMDRRRRKDVRVRVKDLNIYFVCIYVFICVHTSLCMHMEDGVQLWVLFLCSLPPYLWGQGL